MNKGPRKEDGNRMSGTESPVLGEWSSLGQLLKSCGALEGIHFYWAQSSTFGGSPEHQSSKLEFKEP